MGKRSVGGVELSDEEASVWAAVYASSWAHDFRQVEERHGFSHVEADPHFSGGTPFGHAERASTIADIAVLDLRDWEANGKV